MKTQKANPPSSIPSLAAKLIFLTCLLALVTPLTAGTYRYEVTDVGTLPGLADSYLWEQVVNNRGHVAAYGNNAANPNAFAGDAPFLWKGPGEIELLPGLPGATDSIAYGMNNLDQVVGASGAAVGSSADAVLWDDGAVVDLGKLPGDTGSDAIAINNEGVAVGDSYSATTFLAVFWDKSRVIHRLPNLPGDAISGAAAINERGQIAGTSGTDFTHYHAVLWNGGAPVDLGTLGGDISFTIAINSSGQVAGAAQLPNGLFHAAMWHNGVLIDLGTFGSDPYGWSGGLNGRGDIVGFSGQSLVDVATAHALLWQDGQMINLQSQIPADSGWVLQQADSINDKGQIGGIGLHNGQIRAFLLTPVGNHSGQQ